MQLSAKEAEVTALKAKLAALEAEAEGGLGGSVRRLARSLSVTVV